MRDRGAAAAKTRLSAGTRVEFSLRPFLLLCLLPLCVLNCVRFGGNGVFRLLCRPQCSVPPGNEGM